MKRHVIRNLRFAQLRSRIAAQMTHFHPELRKTLLNNISELVAALALAKSVQLSAIGDKLPVDTSAEHESNGSDANCATIPKIPCSCFGQSPKTCWRAWPGARFA